MGNVESIGRNWKKVLLGLLVALSIVWVGAPANAVGPYFENESPGRGQFEGPTPSWPSPETSLWSSPRPLFLSQESLKKNDIMLRKKNPEKADAATQDIAPEQAKTYTAQR